MRLGVLDIGSNTGHLLVVDAHGGAAPLPAHSHKEPLRLAEHLVDVDDEDADGAQDVSDDGIAALTEFVADAVHAAEDKGCEDMLAFATSAVRDAANSQAVLDHVEGRTGVRISVLTGEDEARLTFLAVRRWFGWSAGRLAVFDIGGGSLEIAGGADELPDVAWSLPLGAARLARDHFGNKKPASGDLKELRKQIRAAIARDAGHLLRAGAPDHAAATSKTFRSLARICGAAPSSEGPLVPRVLPLDDLREWIPKLADMAADELGDLPGVSTSRTHQIVPGALVAEACMDIFDLPALEICPWALREGLILERLDQLRALAE
ncbi:Ppx/GppA phosphatase family protein [Nocardioides acrostichi]|uniref:Ppx/GppA family phosphatase n=1 Tax=Nocardioides acrostichi TaxID=2784339 RepID=A0A930V4T2_9ACTN|nr:Ppx/GppA family phosphatase [Nocardioides acrostichi]MBF4163846.1 Ppx/GppA family phosphatase [Nocardioides acrostichi]